MEAGTPKEDQPEAKQPKVCKSSNQGGQLTPVDEVATVIPAMEFGPSTSSGLNSVVSIVNIQDQQGNSIGTQFNDCKIENLQVIQNVVHPTDKQGDKVRPPILERPNSMLPSNQDVLIREYLSSQQQKLCRNVNRFSPATLNTRYQVDITHMYTDLELLKENKKKQDPKPTTLEEFLDIIKSTPACKVLIDGEGGIGKTTLLRYLAYNWATMSDETLKGKIVFLLNIRDMDKGEDILDVIVKQLRLKDFNLKTNLPEDPKLIKRFIMNHDDEIVLLLDGLDELRYGNESLISLFKKEELENSIVILTSRSEEIEIEFIKTSNVHVKVNGFNEDNIKKYIKKHFDYFEVPALADSLIMELQLDLLGDQHQEVFSMCKNPMLLLSVCIMWEERQQLPADKADLFKEFFRTILNQFNKQEGNDQKISKFEDTPEKYVNAMLLLGKCMYEGLKRNQISINKRDLEGKEEMVVLALKLGFVYNDSPSSKADFVQIFTAPHKLIVESLVGFYLYKLSQTAGLVNECTEDMNKLLMPLDDNEWEMIRGSEHLGMAREFAILFLGADAGKFLNNWITDDLSTYRSLMTYLQLVKEEHRIPVEKALIDHMTKTDLEIKRHIDDISKSLKIFIHHINPDMMLNESEHFIQLMTRVHSIDLSRSMNVETFNRSCEQMSSEEKGRLFVHIMIAVPDQEHILRIIHETFADHDIKHLTAECQKLNFKYDITRNDFMNTSCLYLVHLLSHAPKLESLKLYITNAALSGMIRECSSRGAKLELEMLDICLSDTVHSNINGSSLASFLALAPKLNYLDMRECCLSGDTMNDMSNQCSRKGVKLELKDLYISGNNLSSIIGSSLTSLMVIAPKLNKLDLSGCSLSGVVMNDMIRGCSRSGVLLELKMLHINDNDLGNIDRSLLASLILIIAPKLETLDISNCNLPLNVIEHISRECSSSGVKLEIYEGIYSMIAHLMNRVIIVYYY